jgi:CelD/BcsL family acetyltransferase involved in cellulose biosynthesis
MKSAFSHRLLTDVAELDPLQNPGLRKAWDRLATRLRTPLLGFDWFHACATTIHADDPLRVIVVYDGEEVAAIAPLAVVSGRAGNSRLEVLGTSKLYEPSGLLYSSTESLAYLLHTALRSRLPLCLLRIPAPDQSRDIAERLSARQGLSIVRDSAPAAFLELGKSWEGLLASLSSNRRYDFKRKRKRAEALGPVTIEDIRPARDEFAQLFQRAVAIEHASWKGENGSSLQANAGLRRFFETYLSAACDRSECRFFFLNAGDECIAMQIVIEAHGACWVLKQGYRETHARLSPGVQLAHESLRCCIESELERFEFLGSEEDWQSSWPVERHAFSTLLVIPYSVDGARELCGAFVSAARRKSSSGPASSSGV